MLIFLVFFGLSFAGLLAIALVAYILCICIEWAERNLNAAFAFIFLLVALSLMMSSVLFFTLPARAQPMSDMNMVIALDTSGSITESERQLQYDGTIAAFRDPAVLATIVNGPYGGIAVAVTEWSSDGVTVVVDWLLIDSEGAVDQLENALRAHLLIKPSNKPLAQTNTSNAIGPAWELLRNCPYFGSTQVVNVIADGQTNHGPFPSEIRDGMIGEGITINALFIGADPEKVFQKHYEMFVIGGFRHFFMRVDTFSDFAQGMRSKMLTEMALLME